MSDAQITRSLFPEIASPLARLRFYIRGYVCLHALALSIALLGVAFWITLAVDWFFEPPAPVRVLILIATALGLGWVLMRSLVLRMLVPLDDRSLALLLERRHRQLGDRLVTVVELAGRTPESAGFDPRMLTHTEAAARKLMPEVRPGRVLKARPLIVSFFLSAAAAASVALLFISRPATFDTWAQRSLLLSDRRWPRDTRIEVDGFAMGAHHRRSVKVAIGGDIEVHALADTSKRIPDVLEIRYVSQDGSPLRQTMTMHGTAVPGRDPFQHYYFMFKNVQSTIRFDVIARSEGLLGKDDRVEDLWIDAVESPMLTEEALQCHYPGYLNRADESLPVTGIMAVPDGTQIRIAARSSKDLVRAQCQVAAGDRATERTIEVPDHSRRFELPLGTVRQNTVVLFTLHDTDGVSNRQPARLQIRVVPDLVPEVDVRLAGIGRAITPKAILPARGRIGDDHGVVRSWFEFRANNEKEPRQREFKLPAEGHLTKTAGIALDVQNLELAPGGRLDVWIKAVDACPLDKSPHVGTTPRYELEIVTESQLRALLETTELLQHNRLKSVVTDLNRTRDLLARIKSERTLEREELKVDEALQSRQRSSQETLEVAEQFERILEELQNNRVDQFELSRSRLQDGIANPLKRIVAQEFPKLKARLLDIHAVLAEPPRLLAATIAAQQQLDLILRQMDQIMAKMVELDKYNELLAELRSIIQSHENISRLSKERREELKKELRKGLLE